MDVADACSKEITILLYNTSSDYFYYGATPEVLCPISFESCQKMNWYNDITRLFFWVFVVVCLIQNVIFLLVMLSEKRVYMKIILCLLGVNLFIDIFHTLSLIFNHVVRKKNNSMDKYAKGYERDTEKVAVGIMLVNFCYAAKTIGIFLILIVLGIFKKRSTHHKVGVILLVVIAVTLILGIPAGLTAFLEKSQTNYFNLKANGVTLQIPEYVLKWAIVHNYFFFNGFLFFFATLLLCEFLWKRRKFFQKTLLVIRSIPLRMNLGTFALAKLESQLMSYNSFCKGAMYSAMFNAILGLMILACRLPLLLHILHLKGKKLIYAKDKYELYYYMALSDTSEMLMVLNNTIYTLTWLSSCPQYRYILLATIFSVVPRALTPASCSPEKLNKKLDMAKNYQIYSLNGLSKVPNEALIQQAVEFIPYLQQRRQDVQQLKESDMAARAEVFFTEDHMLKTSRLYMAQKMFSAIAHTNVTELVNTLEPSERKQDEDVVNVPTYQALLHMSNAVGQEYLYDQMLTKEERAERVARKHEEMEEFFAKKERGKAYKPMHRREVEPLLLDHNDPMLKRKKKMPKDMYRVDPNLVYKKRKKDGVAHLDGFSELESEGAGFEQRGSKNKQMSRISSTDTLKNMGSFAEKM